MTRSSLACLLALATLSTSSQSLAQHREAALLHRPPVSPSGGQYGRGLEVEGEWVFVGDIGSDTVSIFRRGADGWKLSQIERGSKVSRFGHAIAVDGETLAVGAYTDGWPDEPRGSVTVFQLDGTEWLQTQYIPSPGFLNLADLFGVTVAIDGDWPTCIWRPVASASSPTRTGTRTWAAPVRFQDLPARG